MASWAVFTIGFGAVLLHALASRKSDPHWYLSVIIPLLYGGIIAWMFVGENVVLSLQIIVFGTVIPILFLVFSQWNAGNESQGEWEDAQYTQERGGEE